MKEPVLIPLDHAVRVPDTVGEKNGAKAVTKGGSIERGLQPGHTHYFNVSFVS